MQNCSFMCWKKLLAAFEILTVMQLNTLPADAEASGNPRVPLWLHKGATSFMSMSSIKNSIGQSENPIDWIGGCWFSADPLFPG